MLPYTLNFFVELNVPIPFNSTGVKPSCFHKILFPALIVGVDDPAVNVSHVFPPSRLYCKSFSENVNDPSSNASNVKYCFSYEISPPPPCISMLPEPSND